MPVPATESSEAFLSILLGETAEGEDSRLRADRANQHLILTGVTGTGKTETLKTVVVGFSDIGVPTFLPDVKGDLESLARVAPAKLWDLSGERGETIMVSVRDMGSTLFSRMLGLSDAQKRVTTLIFAVARTHRMPLDTFDHVRDVLDYIEADENRVEIARMGYAASATTGIIRGTLLELEEEGADQFFGPTTFALDHLMGTHQGRGVVSILRADNIIHSPRTYSCFLLWLLTELSRKMPEVGNQEKPRLAFVFDEAHFLFNDAPKFFINAVENIVRTIRSKGVSINLVTQGLADIPDAILAQLNNRIQHRLTSASAKDQKGLQIAATVLPANGKLGPLEPVIKNLGTGWALVSVLDEHGVPSKTEKVRIRRVEVPADARPLLVDEPDEIVRMIRDSSQDNIVPFRPKMAMPVDEPEGETVEEAVLREFEEETTIQAPVASLPVAYEPPVVPERQRIMTAPAVIEPLLPPIQPQAPVQAQTVSVESGGMFAGHDINIGTLHVVNEAPVIAPPVIETPAWAAPKPQRKLFGFLRALRHTPLLMVASVGFWATSALLPVAVTVANQTVVL